MRATSLLFAALLLLPASALAQSGKAPAVYPNPLSGPALTVEVADTEGASVEILDVLGRRVAAGAPLAAGVYLVRVAYADGRVTAPTRLTRTTGGPLQVRLVASTAAPAPEAQAASTEAPSKQAFDDVIGTEVVSGVAGDCAGRYYAGFCHEAFRGRLAYRRPDELRVSTDANRVADYNVSMGEVYGVSLRYTVPGDGRERPFQILTRPFNDSFVSYVATIRDGGVTYDVIFGPVEAPFDDDGNPATPDVPAVAFGFDVLPPTKRAATTPPATLKGGGYEIIVLDGDTVTLRSVVPDGTPLYAVDPSGDNRIFLERAIGMTSIAEGFEVAGGTKPGDASAVFKVQNGAGDPVTFHVGPGGATTATGTSVHITPVFELATPSNFGITNLRVFANRVNRYNVRAMRFATGSASTGSGQAVAQWARPASFFGTQQGFAITNPVAPVIAIDRVGFPRAPLVGLQIGREPAPLQEIPSEIMRITHDGPTGGAGIAVDGPGDRYVATARFRNETDNQDETAAVTWRWNNGAPSYSVKSDNSTFSEYELVFESGGSATSTVIPTGVETAFPLGSVVFGSVTSGPAPGVSQTGELYAISMDVTVPGGTLRIYVFPKFASTGAMVQTRWVAPESSDPHTITSLTETSLPPGTVIPEDPGDER